MKKLGKVAEHVQLTEILFLFIRASFDSPVLFFAHELPQRNWLFGFCREMPQDIVVVSQQSSVRA